MNFIFQWATERVFNSIAIINIELSVDKKSGSTLSSFPHHEIALIIIKINHISPKQKRKLPTKIGIIFILASIGKNSFLFRVRMKVSEHKYFLYFVRLKYSLSCSIYLRMRNLISSMPNSIKVVP